MNIFATLYDNLMLNPDFAQDLFDLNTYYTVGLLMLVSSFVWMLLYYYLVSNYGNFYKLTKWIFWILILAIINFCVGYYISELAMFNLFNPEDYPYTVTDFFNFSIVNVLWTILFCLVFSLILKIKSTTASKTPF